MKNWFSDTTPNDSLLGLLCYVELQPDSNVLQVLNETNQVNKGPFSGCDMYMYVSLWAEADRKWMVNSHVLLTQYMIYPLQPFKLF